MDNMHYFAGLNRYYVCTSIIAIDDATYQENTKRGYKYETEFSIRVDSYDESLIMKKKYVAGEWRDCFPSETEKIQDKEIVHMPDDRWLSEVIGNTYDLSTNAQGSLVAAINECVARIASLETQLAAARRQLQEQ